MTQERAFPRWAPALFLTLALHLGVGGVLRHVDLFGATPAHTREPELVELVFAPPRDPDESRPRPFTELPPDRSEAAPEEADLLSNVDSRARDRVPGGDDDLARQDGRTDIPQVALETGDPSPPSPESAPAPRTPPEPEAAEDPAEEDPEPSDVARNLTAERRDLRPDAADPWAAFREPPPPSPPIPPTANSLPSAPTRGGASDIAQEAMAASDANAEFPGDISLNTRAWEFAPWLLAFRRELMESWTAPLGYHLGLIHGWTLLEVVVAPNGEVLSNQVLDQEGNVAFRQSSLAAIERSMPYLPLPDDFPEETLVLTIRMNYPEWQPSPPPMRRAAGRRRSR